MGLRFPAPQQRCKVYGRTHEKSKTVCPLSIVTARKAFLGTITAKCVDKYLCYIKKNIKRKKTYVRKIGF